MCLGAARAANPPLRDLYPQEFRGGSWAGLQFPARPARGWRNIHQDPSERGLAAH